MVEIILKKVKGLDMGHSLNHIQDVAEKVLSKKRWHQYLVSSSQDAEDCEDMDGLLLNGEYFDWRSFGPQKNNIVRAYLRYFTEDEISKIALAL